MADHGHDLVFGTLLEPPERAHGVLELAELCEQSGLDLVTLSDHPYWPERLDTVALLSAIVARTTRVRVMPNLANLPLRPPAMLARTATTLDILSNGRFDLGVATGAQQLWDSIVAEGGPAWSAGDSIAALEEAVQIIRALWTADGDVHFEGKYYRLQGAKPCLASVHDIAIWLGAYQPRMLRLTGRIADGWLPSSPGMPPERLAAANKIIDEGAVEAGRSPEAVRRGYNIEGTFSGNGTGFLQGPPAVWAEQLAEITLTQGISTYILYRVSSADTIKKFAADVVPAVREAVAAERSRRAMGSSG
jgi:alkanesulfonate monooxygenase SsuD/methylene tetrahydromethanopterin reductase-like flavin-dependent oxidoreductase (luciferase family)